MSRTRSLLGLSVQINSNDALGHLSDLSEVAPFRRDQIQSRPSRSTDFIVTRDPASTKIELASPIQIDFRKIYRAMTVLSF